MISCPGENILSVSSVMRSLYTGHKFHSRTLATEVLAFCKQIAFPVTILPTACSLGTPRRCSRCSLPPLRLLRLAAGWNERCFSTTLRLAWCNSSDAFSQFDHDKEPPQWNYLHLLKLSIRSVVQLMKSPGSEPLLSTTLLAIHTEMETQVSISPLACELKSWHHVNSLVTDNHARRKRDPCLYLTFYLIYN